MTLQNNEFDRILVELNAKLSEIQKQIGDVEKAKAEYIRNQSSNLRKNFLVANSIVLKDVKLEVISGNYFIVGEDDTFEYVMRLTKDQAEVLADDLDHELGKAHVDSLFQKELVNNIIHPVLKKIQ